MQRTKICSLALMLAMTAPAAAADPGCPAISWMHAADHYGKCRTVYGKVVATKDIGSRCFLNFHENYRSTFTVVINQENYDKFPESPESLYADKNVRVVGEIVQWQSKPEIIVTAPDQITIVDSPDPPADEMAKAATKSADKSAEKPNASSKKTERESKPAKTYKVPADGVVRIATYNVLNLFDEYDDPYIPDGKERLPGKETEELVKLARVFHKLDADVLALQEVENRGVLTEFVGAYLADMGYQEIVLYEGNSDRGIDVGLLSRFPIGAVTSHRHRDFVDGNGDPMRFHRDLLQVEILPKGRRPFEVWVVHLKSKYGGADATMPIRLGETRTIRRILDKRLKNEPDARIAICGDFNDTFDSKPVQHLVGDGSTALASFFAELDKEERITFNREPYRSMIDFILVTPGLAGTYVSDSFAILPGTVESSGSDHNPVAASVKLPPGP